MSRRRPDRIARPRHPVLFAALGDRTRLVLVEKLSAGEPRSIAQLAAGSRLTRQAITKHLRVLEHAGVVHSARSGRESLFELAPDALSEMSDYLNRVSRQWDHALARLKSFVEEKAP